MAVSYTHLDVYKRQGPEHQRDFDLSESASNGAGIHDHADRLELWNELDSLLQRAGL